MLFGKPSGVESLPPLGKQTQICPKTQSCPGGCGRSSRAELPGRCPSFSSSRPAEQPPEGSLHEADVQTTDRGQTGLPGGSQKHTCSARLTRDSAELACGEHIQFSFVFLLYFKKPEWLNLHRSYNVVQPQDHHCSLGACRQAQATALSQTTDVQAQLFLSREPSPTAWAHSRTELRAPRGQALSSRPHCELLGVRSPPWPVPCTLRTRVPTPPPVPQEADAHGRGAGVRHENSPRAQCRVRPCASSHRDTLRLL